MMITAPNAFVAEVHDRMPVLLAESDYEPWLSGEAGIEKPAPEKHLATLAGVKAAPKRLPMIRR